MKFHNGFQYHKFFLLVAVTLILLAVFLMGCTNTTENDGFIIQSWSTRGSGTNHVNLTIVVKTPWSFGRVDLYDPSGRFVDFQNFSNTTHNITFFITQTKYYTPLLGTYHLYATEIVAGANHSMVKKDIILHDANLLITRCSPFWVFDTTLQAYIFKSVNLTIENHGDFFDFIWEGRIIVDNQSIFNAPDYHWHDLNIWIGPGEIRSLDLPVEVPIKPQEKHYVKIFLQDTDYVTVASYESQLSIPVVP